MKRINLPGARDHLKRNWFFPISAMAFYCLSIDNSLAYCIGMPVAFASVLLISAWVPSVWEEVRSQCTSIKLFCGATALGICWANQNHFYQQTFKLMLPHTWSPLFLAISYVGAAAAFAFLYVWFSYLWNRLIEVFRENKTFQDVTLWEAGVYAILFLLSVGFSVYAFSRTQVFYGTEYSYDLIYTSDSPALVKGGVYYALTHLQNDLRQPTFAVFSAPFVGISYLLVRLFGVSAQAEAVLVNIPQIFILFVANFLLAKTMALKPLERICFLLVCCLSYTHLLFVLMMEQYIVAYFWLILTIYLIREKNRPDRFALWGAGSTLLTSMILLPFMSEKSPIRQFKAWLLDMVRYGLEFVALMLVFCRLDVILSLAAKITYLGDFTGHSVTMPDKIYQYTAFISGCFAAPAAAPIEYGWYLKPVTGIHIAGVVILLLAIVSAVVNRKRRDCQLAACWVGFSILMLVGLGWGTSENGLILYALYFGWALLVLLFQLVNRIGNALKLKFLLPVCSAVAAALLAAVNIPALMEMLGFAASVHPA